MVFVLSVVVAASLLAMAAVANAEFVVAAQKAYEYAHLRAAWPLMLLASDNESVYLCVNTTYPVFVMKGGQFVQARPMYFTMVGNAMQQGNMNGRGHAYGLIKHARWRTSQGSGDVFCLHYLGAYKPGDSVAYEVVGQYSTYFHNVTIAVAPPR
ncbi:MAG: hypothetical protein QXP36_00595 [Conexivisphaerales archaeon]